jgi:hypothetical protein
MSPRDTYWFIAGAASGVAIGALGVYFLVAPSGLVGSPARAPETNRTDVLMPGDRWPTLADADSTVGRTDAGSLDTVTQNLAQRLATNGGTDDEWRLLAQSYEYMGRTDDARAARMHVSAKTDAAKKTTTTASESSRIWGTVQIDDKLAALASPGTTLFIYATDTESAGPPLAVLRLRVDRWPMSFVLDDADAMIPGRNLSTAKSIQLEARISPSGEALPRPGDLVGHLSAVDPHIQHPVNISIDRKIT